jgi:phage-related protein (TIGR01555 family)
MGRVLSLVDRLTNALTGTGSRRDPRSANAYQARILTQHEIAAAYSGSGLLRKICTIPASDMVREWRTWTGGDDDQIAAVFDAEKRFALRQKVKQVEILRALGGGALILGLPGDPTQPAPPNSPLAFLHVVSRWHLGFERLNNDATSAGYGEPEMWTLNAGGGQVRLHPSRVIPFRADTSASLIIPGTSGLDEFWGESVVQQVLEAVQDSDTARASFAALIHKARLLRIGIPNLIEIASEADGEALIMQRLSVMAAAESIHNATIFDAGDPENGKGGEVVQDATYTFAGAKDVLNAYGEWVASISDIPATRLLGRAPEGMNSSGESQQKDWNKRVRAMQTIDLAPCLDRLDPHLLAAAGSGVAAGLMSYEFDPLDSPSEAERATIFKTEMEAIEKLQTVAAVPEQALSRGVQSLMIERGYLPELELALAEIPETERFGVVPEDDIDPDGEPQPGNGGAIEEGGERSPAARVADHFVMTARDMRPDDCVTIDERAGFVIRVTDTEVTVAFADGEETFKIAAIDARWIGRADDGVLSWDAILKGA